MVLHLGKIFLLNTDLVLEVNHRPWVNEWAWRNREKNLIFLYWQESRFGH
ncbi:unnamed protein product [Nyctereutes procyonoides]|uniref:(raccoon dog) hypothetical protein n=1 Tax=Nyctereutes procyonoides TaxID=34880 RepID=A0A811ZRZ4_NYCPR|nr:unnamed protein product [Nyctereutes procyonoides]